MIKETKYFLQVVKEKNLATILIPKNSKNYCFCALDHPIETLEICSCTLLEFSKYYLYFARNWTGNAAIVQITVA